MRTKTRWEAFFFGLIFVFFFSLHCSLAADVSEEAVKILAELKSASLDQQVANACKRYPSMAPTLIRVAAHDPVRELWDQGKVSSSE